MMATRMLLSYVMDNGLTPMQKTELYMHAFAGLQRGLEMVRRAERHGRPNHLLVLNSTGHIPPGATSAGLRWWTVRYNIDTARFSVCDEVWADGRGGPPRPFSTAEQLVELFGDEIICHASFRPSRNSWNDDDVSEEYLRHRLLYDYSEMAHEVPWSWWRRRVHERAAVLREHSSAKIQRVWREVSDHVLWRPGGTRQRVLAEKWPELVWPPVTPLLTKGGGSLPGPQVMPAVVPVLPVSPVLPGRPASPDGRKTNARRKRLYNVHIAPVKGHAEMLAAIKRPRRA